MSSRVVGFKKIKFYTNENVGSGELDLPEQQMHTTAYWLTVPQAVMAALPYAPDDRRDGVVGLSFAMRQVAQLLLMCDRQDIGVAIGSGDEGDAGARSASPAGDDRAARIFIYDNYPGGIGFSQPLFAMHAELLARTRAMIAGCACERGCPTCVGPVGDTGPLAKLVALRILDLPGAVRCAAAAIDEPPFEVTELPPRAPEFDAAHGGARSELPAPIGCGASFARARGPWSRGPRPRTRLARSRRSAGRHRGTRWTGSASWSSSACTGRVIATAG